MKRARPVESLEREENEVNDGEPAREHETHLALLNDIVLENIFKYLSYKDLKACRDVKNCIWLRNSKKAWWSRTKVVFGNNGTSVEKIRDYLNEAAITSNAKNYRFCMYERMPRIFWNSVGRSIKYLAVPVGYHDLSKLICTHCPNVEELHIGSIYFSKHFDPGHLKTHEPQFGQQTNLKTLVFGQDSGKVPWKEFLLQFPNLQTLKGHIKDEKIYKAISSIRQDDPNLLKLQGIKLNAVYPFANRNKTARLVFLDPSLSLKNITITFETCTEKTLEDILDLHANSLKQLSVSRDGFRYMEVAMKKICVRKPLENLEEVTLRNCFFTVGFFKYIPNVRKFELSYEEASINLLQTTEPNFTITTCQELTLNISKKRQRGKKPNSDLTFFVNMFPNMEVFKTIELNNSEFSMICERWTKLRSLETFESSEINEVGLLGYDPESPAPFGARRPNITNLKYLQSITIKCAKFSYPRIKNGRIILKELEGLQHLKKIKFEYCRLLEADAWEEIYAKYSGP